MLGRPNQSAATRHRGRRLGLSERDIFAPHPPGHLRQAHLRKPSLSTTTNSPDLMSMSAGIRSATRVSKSALRRPMARNSRVTARRPLMSRSERGRDQHQPVPNSRRHRKFYIPAVAMARPCGLAPARIDGIGLTPYRAVTDSWSGPGSTRSQPSPPPRL